MEPRIDPYNRALASARSRFFAGDQLPKAQVAKLLDEFAEMLRKIVSLSSAGLIHEERAPALTRSILRAMREYAEAYQITLVTGVGQAAMAAAEAHVDALAVASKAAGIPFTHSFDDVPRAAIASIMARRGLDIEGGGVAATYKTLMRRKLTAIAPEIDTIVTSAIGRGERAGRLTKSLAKTMARDDPALLAAIKRMGPRGGLLRSAIEEGVTLDPEITRRAKSLLYDSRRIAISEINTAYHEANVMGMIESPVVEAIRWQTSGRHAGLPADICDVMEQADLYDLGAGVYPKELFPSKQHPHCMCTGIAVVKKPSDWGKPDPLVPEAKFLGADDVRKFMPDDATDKFIEGQLRMGNSKLAAAASAYGQ